MSEVSVPSTLVKCLYLFFDLPELSEKEANTKDTNSDFTPKERRILLQKIFVQVSFYFILIFSFNHTPAHMYKLNVAVSGFNRYEFFLAFNAAVQS